MLESSSIFVPFLAGLAAMKDQQGKAKQFTDSTADDTKNSNNVGSEWDARKHESSQKLRDAREQRKDVKSKVETMLRYHDTELKRKREGEEEEEREARLFRPRQSREAPPITRNASVKISLARPASAVKKPTKAGMAIKAKITNVTNCFSERLRSSSTQSIRKNYKE